MAWKGLHVNESHDAERTSVEPPTTCSGSRPFNVEKEVHQYAGSRGVLLARILDDHLSVQGALPSPRNPQAPNQASLTQRRKDVLR